MDAPKAKTVYSASMKSFLGIDLRNAPSKVDMQRSPMCVNMIRDTIGTNRKRRGYETVRQLTGRVNGFHTLIKYGEQKHIIHAGDSLYEFDPKTDEIFAILGGAGDNFSVSKQMNSKLYILDSKTIRVYDGESVKDIASMAYVPTTIIAKSYNGGGQTLEPVNLITPYRKELFTGDSTHTTFQLGATDIDEATVEIRVQNSDLTYSDLAEGTDFTVDRTLGTFTLTEPKKTPVDGQDNITVKYAKTIEGYADRINKCSICVLYGMNGQRDRLFVSGNPDYPNYDWYCKANNPTYFADTWYCVLGQDDSAIIGYSILNGQLLTFKDGAANDSNIIIRVGTYDENTKQNVFVTSGNYEAAGALNGNTFVSMKNEPMYLTVTGSVHAGTPSDILGERSSQERSYFISEALAREPHLKDAFAIQYEDFYMLAVNDKVYILDTAQATYERNAPYSTRQYECYLWTGIGARVLAEIDGVLYFGTSDGKVKRFFSDKLGEKSMAYVDDGVITEKAITVDGQIRKTKESFPCYWETAEIYTGGTDHAELKKTFKHLVVALNAFAHTGCRVWANIDGIWELIFDYDSSANYFDFEDVDFGDFSFRTDDTPTLIGGKFKAKKLLHIQFRFENSKPQPFSILFAKTKYTVGNEYRK